MALSTMYAHRIFKKAVVAVVVCVFICVAMSQPLCYGQLTSRTPRFDIRAIHLTLWKATGRDKVKQTKQDVISTIRRASGLGFNTVILQVTGMIQLRRTPEFATEWAYSIDDVKEMIVAARQADMEVIPEVKLLTKQEFFMKRINKNFMLNPGDYDPNKPEVYPIVFRVLDEVIEIFQPHSLLIGHDEAFGYLKRENLRFGRLLNAADFYKDVVTVHDYLIKNGIRTLMWADMLLDARVYNAMYDNSGAYGTPEFSALLDSIPKDIVLIDWHYRTQDSFPSYTYLQSKGFTVWGATFQISQTIKAFTDYVAKYARRGEGMVATTWWPFVIQDEKTIDLILKTSSEEFFK